MRVHPSSSNMFFFVPSPQPHLSPLCSLNSSYIVQLPWLQNIVVLLHCILYYLLSYWGSWLWKKYCRDGVLLLPNAWGLSCRVWKLEAGVTWKLVCLHSWQCDKFCHLWVLFVSTWPSLIILASGIVWNSSHQECPERKTPMKKACVLLWLIFGRHTESLPHPQSMLKQLQHLY